MRSIPACTGEPRAVHPVAKAPEVYPRVYGGTVSSATQIGVLRGLSPRVRGNHLRIPLSDSLSRSIPACTGEPTVSYGAPGSVQVYPRVYGGTDANRDGLGVWMGLSPRVRGNRERRSDWYHAQRSIPACTGEPSCPDHRLCQI